MGSAVEIEGVSKRYGPVLALDSVSMHFAPGEVHAVVGENGAGKSTLIGVLGGFVRPDAGSVKVGDVRLVLGHPAESARAGIAMVHQHFMLVPRFTVAENLALARAREARWVLDPNALSAKGLESGKALGWRVESDAKVGDLSVGVQQRLEILKALASEGMVILLDEPTAVLRDQEVEELFRVVRKLKSDGRTVVLIAHKLSEVLSVADRITVLRKGKVVATVPREEANEAKIAELMLGEPPPRMVRHSAVPGKAAIRTDNLVVRGDRGETRVDRVTLELQTGEVVGVGGVDGNGQIELAEALVGIRDVLRGSIQRLGQVVYLPPDRHRDGLALDLTVEDNLLIEGHRREGLHRGPFLLGKKIRDWAEGLKRVFSIDTPRVDVPVRQLSGGNQQKVIVARALDRQPQIVVAVNPTRGLDVRASAFVRSKLRHAAENGAAVAVFSSDRDELAEIADRTLYMSSGQLSHSEDVASMLGVVR